MTTRRAMLALAAAGLVLTGAALPQEPPRGEDPVASLARDVDRAESLRAIKTLQRLYAHYAQFGLWREVGDLFAPDGSFRFDGQIMPGQTVRGPAAIAAFLRGRYGGGHEGLEPGDVRTMMIEAPLISLSPDGRSARGRWYILIFKGEQGSAGIEGGTFDNDYVREGGAWKIAAARYFPQFEGPYEVGWTNWGGGDLPMVPYHFTPDSAGVPIPAPEGPSPTTDATLQELGQRIAALNDEDQVRNLQSAYGYYADRRMWDDVVDLFAVDGLVEVAGTGVYRGPAGIRRWLESIGPAGLRHGELNDRPQFDTIVTMAPGGNEAWARGIELGMLGEADSEQGWWEVAVFRNRFVKEDGIWKIREMRRFPLFKADYYQGWGRSRIVDPVPDGRHAPDEPVPAADAAPAGLAMPALLQAHPVTGRPVAAPPPLREVAATPLTGAIRAAGPPITTLAEARRRLAMSLAYDGVENVSAAYTYYLDDYQSPLFSALMAEKGFKMSAFAGYYVGRDRITEAGVRVWGTPPVTRTGIHFHWRVQPVIMVAADGRSANARFRLFQPRTGKEVGGPGDWYGASFFTGIYHDQFVLEQGIWRFWNLSLDEPYMTMAGWKGGWGKVKDPKEPPQGPPSKLIGTYPPDIPVTALGKRQEHFRGGTGVTLQWPSILPMWFAYRNPVSGRIPENFQADCPPCTVAPQLRLDRNGYLEPPMGPEPKAAD